MRRLSLEAALSVVERLGFYVCDEGLPESALARPVASVFGFGELLGGDLPLINGYVLRWFASPDQVPPAADMAISALICARLLRRLVFK